MYLQKSNVSNYQVNFTEIACRERLKTIAKTMIQQLGVKEALKAADQMAWVGEIQTLEFFQPIRSFSMTANMSP